jgi:mono/diheme cytochrome c family protein
MKLSRTGGCWSRAMLWGALLAAGVSAAHADAAEPNRIYDANCALCHQKAGTGLKGQFPRLAGRASEIGATPAGRRYLIEVTVFGMAGTVEVDGASFLGVMPPFAALSDEDLASALSYVLSLDAPAQSPSAARGQRPPPVIEATDVKGVRGGQQLSPTQVRAKREAVLAAKKN